MSEPYPEELRASALDFYFAHPEFGYHVVADKYGVSASAVCQWAYADERYQRKTSRKYSLDNKEAAIEYCLDHSERTVAALSGELGIPFSTLAGWLAGDLRYARRNETYSKEFRKEVVDYFLEHGGSLQDLSDRFEVKKMTIHKWLVADPRYQEQRKSRPAYTDEQKKAALDWYFATPGAMHPQVFEKFGYPQGSQTFHTWCHEDPRYGQIVERGYTEEQIRTVCEYYLSSEKITLRDAINECGYPKTCGALKNWLAKYCGFKPKPKSCNEESLQEAVEALLSDRNHQIRAVADRYGVSETTLKRRAVKDPRWERDKRALEEFEAGSRLSCYTEAVDYYFVHSYLTFEQVSEHFGGKPHPGTLSRWVKEDARYGDPAIYGCTEEQKQRVLDFHIDNPGAYAEDIEKALGFPVPRRGYREWRVLEARKNSKPGKIGQTRTRRTFFEKAEVVLSIEKDQLSRRDASELFGVALNTVHNWHGVYSAKGMIGLLGKNDLPRKKTKKVPAGDAARDPAKMTLEEIRDIVERNNLLEERNDELEFENDVCHAIFEVLKKDQGLSLEPDVSLLTNREKTMVINSLRPKYKLKPLLTRFDISKNTYQNNCHAIERGDKYARLRPLIHDAFEASGDAYGYRRITAQLRKPKEEGGFGVVVSEKVVRRVMREDGIITLPEMRMKRYNSYRGSLSPAAPNLLKRDFHADAPGEKLLTDVTEFQLNGFKMYLSPVIDCFNGEVVSYTISQHPTLDLVTDMLRTTVERVGRNLKTVIHSDQGWHYQHAAYRQMLRDAGWNQSMSRKGCSPDNSACEGFFGRLKNEFFYNHGFIEFTPEMFAGALSQWIDWYNEGRIKESLGYISPSAYRFEWESSLHHQQAA